jgi:ribosomal protein S18 acetylase RimI-like enzyme
MRVVNIDSKMKEKLLESGLLNEMSNLEECDFLVIAEQNGKIIGASGVGGKIHVNTLIVQEKFRNKGIGALLLKDIINESKKRNYPFLIASRDPENMNAVRLHDYFELKAIFQIAYSTNFTRDVIFRSFSKKGDIIKKLLSFFNSKTGTITLILSMKILKNSLFKKVLTYSPEEFPDPNITHCIKNFKKINSK